MHLQMQTLRRPAHICRTLQRNNTGQWRINIYDTQFHSAQSNIQKQCQSIIQSIKSNNTSSNVARAGRPGYRCHRRTRTKVHKLPRVRIHNQVSRVQVPKERARLLQPANVVRDACAGSNMNTKRTNRTKNEIRTANRQSQPSIQGRQPAGWIARTRSCRS